MALFEAVGGEVAALTTAALRQLQLQVAEHQRSKAARLAAGADPFASTPPRDQRTFTSVGIPPHRLWFPWELTLQDYERRLLDATAAGLQACIGEEHLRLHMLEYNVLKQRQAADKGRPFVPRELDAFHVVNFLHLRTGRLQEELARMRGSPPASRWSPSGLGSP